MKQISATYGEVLLLALLACGAASAGLVSRTSLELEGGGGGGGGVHGHVEHHDEEAKPYNFGYGVKDVHQGLDFNQQEASDGHVVSGHYRVQLPDGRTQVVTYTADWKNGYNANVQYEGEAAHPKVVAAVAAPVHGWQHGGAEHLSAPEYSLASASSGVGGASSYSSGGSDHSGSSTKWIPSHSN